MEGRGLKISRNKTDYLSCSEHHDLEIRLRGEEVERVKTYKYLGSTGEYNYADSQSLKIYFKETAV